MKLWKMCKERKEQGPRCAPQVMGRTKDVHAPRVTQNDPLVRYEASLARDGPNLSKEAWSRLSKVVLSTASKTALRSRASTSVDRCPYGLCLLRGK